MRMLLVFIALVGLLLFIGCTELSPEQKAARDEFKRDLAQTTVFISRVSQKLADLGNQFRAGELTLVEFTTAAAELYAEKEELLAHKEKLIGDIEDLGKQGVPWYYLVTTLLTEAYAIWKLIQYKGATSKLMAVGNYHKPFKTDVGNLGDEFINGLAAKRFPKHGTT